MEVSDIFVFSFFSKILWVLFFCICFQEEELNNNGNTYRRMTKPCKGGARTGWPQHVWALELKQWYPKILLVFLKRNFLGLFLREISKMLYTYNYLFSAVSFLLNILLQTSYIILVDFLLVEIITISSLNTHLHVCNSE